MISHYKDGWLASSTEQLMPQTSSIGRRMLTGFCVAVIATLTFHQAMWSLLFFADLMGPPFPLSTNRFGVPLIASICIWRGLWGAAYGAASAWHLKSAWLSGLLFGLFVGASEWVSAFFRSGDWTLSPSKWLYLMQALVINGFWGLGLGIMLPVLSAKISHWKGRHP